jgi:hypothetical protein
LTNEEVVNYSWSFERGHQTRWSSREMPQSAMEIASCADWMDNVLFGRDINSGGGGWRDYDVLDVFYNPYRIHKFLRREVLDGLGHYCVVFADE